MYDMLERELPPQPTAVLRARLAVTEIPAWIGGAFAVIAEEVNRQGALLCGPPFARYTSMGEDGVFDIEAGFPVAPAIADGSAVVGSELPGGHAVTTMHVGPYDRLAEAYDAIQDWLRAHGATATGAPWEVYLSEPEGDPADWRTEVLQPCQAA
jgi:effector-binding domain-containing protein